MHLSSQLIYNQGWGLRTKDKHLKEPDKKRSRTTDIQYNKVDLSYMAKYEFKLSHPLAQFTKTRWSRNGFV